MSVCLSVCLYTCRGQKSALDPLKLGLQTCDLLAVAAGIPTRVLRQVSLFNHGVVSPASALQALEVLEGNVFEQMSDISLLLRKRG